MDRVSSERVSAVAWRGSLIARKIQGKPTYFLRPPARQTAKTRQIDGPPHLVALAAAMTDTLATKYDLSEVRHEVHELPIRTMRLGTVTVAAIGTVSAIVKLL